MKLFGPLASFAGTWQGSIGDDTAPSDDRGVENNAFREQIVFTPMSPVVNHEQTLYVLSYTRTAWRIKEEDPFHQQLGYWIWDPARKQVMHSFMIPRGVTVLAGGHAEPNANKFTVAAARGSATYGICSNPFLDAEFRTVQYDATIEFLTPYCFTYEEDTQIRILGQDAVFHHIDRNRLEKAKS